MRGMKRKRCVLWLAFVLCLTGCKGAQAEAGPKEAGWEMQEEVREETTTEQEAETAADQGTEGAEGAEGRTLAGGNLKSVWPALEQELIPEIGELDSYAERVTVSFPVQADVQEGDTIALEIRTPDLASGADAWLKEVFESEYGKEPEWNTFLNTWLGAHEEERNFVLQATVREGDNGFYLESSRELNDAVNGGVPGYLRAFGAKQAEEGHSELRELSNENEWQFSYGKVLGLAVEMAHAQKAGDGNVYVLFTESAVLAGTMDHRTFQWDGNPEPRDAAIFVLDQPILVYGYEEPIEEIQLMMDGEEAKQLDGKHLIIHGVMEDGMNTSWWIRDIAMLDYTYTIDE